MKNKFRCHSANEQTLNKAWITWYYATIVKKLRLTSQYIPFGTFFRPVRSQLVPPHIRNIPQSSAPLTLCWQETELHTFCVKNKSYNSSNSIFRLAYFGLHVFDYMWFSFLEHFLFAYHLPQFILKFTLNSFQGSVILLPIGGFCISVAAGRTYFIPLLYV
jgi:hypothetical protein